MNAYYDAAIYGPVLQDQAKFKAFTQDPILAGLLDLVKNGTAARLSRRLQHGLCRYLQQLRRAQDGPAGRHRQLGLRPRHGRGAERRLRPSTTSTNKRSRGSGTAPAAASRHPTTTAESQPCSSHEAFAARTCETRDAKMQRERPWRCDSSDPRPANRVCRPTRSRRSLPMGSSCRWCCCSSVSSPTRSSTRSTCRSRTASSARHGEWIGLANFRYLRRLAGVHERDLEHDRARRRQRCASSSPSGSAWRSSSTSAFRAGALFRSFLMLPWAMPAFVAFLTWRVLYQPIGGGINLVLTEDRASIPRSWTGSASARQRCRPSSWRRSGAAFRSGSSAFWRRCRTIPAELYEAARIDGANAWQRFRRHISRHQAGRDHHDAALVDLDRELLRKCLAADAGRSVRRHDGVPGAGLFRHADPAHRRGGRSVGRDAAGPGDPRLCRHVASCSAETTNEPCRLADDTPPGWTPARTSSASSRSTPSLLVAVAVRAASRSTGW